MVGISFFYERLQICKYALCNYYIAITSSKFIEFIIGFCTYLNVLRYSTLNLMRAIDYTLLRGCVYGWQPEEAFSYLFFFTFSVQFCAKFSCTFPCIGIGKKVLSCIYLRIIITYITVK